MVNPLVMEISVFDFFVISRYSFCSQSTWSRLALFDRTGLKYLLKSGRDHPMALYGIFTMPTPIYTRGMSNSHVIIC